MVNAKLTGLHETLAKCHPSIERGVVWCKTCGSSQKVDPAQCLAYGWPKCHGETMTIDHPSTWRHRFVWDRDGGEVCADCGKGISEHV